MYRGFVVEDNGPVRSALVEGLAELAGVTTVGFTGDERVAIQWLADPANEWEICIVDLHLGAGGSGYRVLGALAQRQPHQKVVVWTATADVVARTRCRMLGCDRVFDRATEMSELMDYCMAESAARAIGRLPEERFSPPPRAMAAALLSP
jgi:two-component system OmpR family response regulator